MPVPVTHILGQASIRRRRCLALGGRVLVRTQQQVTVQDVIAEAVLPERHVSLDVASAIRLSERSATQKITRQVGEMLQKDDVVAESGGLFSRVYRTPFEGRIVNISHGRVLLETTGAPFQVKAGLNGMVTEILSDRGALIETTGALVQGRWGNGGVAGGQLKLMSQDGRGELTTDGLPGEMAATLLVAGHCQSADALLGAAELPLAGLVLASLNPSLIEMAARLSLPVMVVEGFSRQPLDAAALKILVENENQESCLNACVWRKENGERPELIIPHPGFNRETVDYDDLKPGLIVRVNSNRNENRVGIITDLPRDKVMLPSGITARAAVVSLENHEECILPVANLDIIG